MSNQEPLKIDTKTVSPNLRTYLEFVRLVESLAVDEKAFSELVHEEAEFREYPNLLNKNGQTRNYTASLEGLKTAGLILSEHQFEIVGYAEDGEQVVVEKIWTGKMVQDIGRLKKGQELKAYICAFVECKDDKIYRHRTYGC